MKIKLSKKQWQSIGRTAGWMKESSEEHNDARKMFNDQGMSGHTSRSKTLLGFRYNTGNNWTEFKEVETGAASHEIERLNNEDNRDGSWSVLGHGDSDQLDDIRFKRSKSPSDRVVPSFGKANWETRDDYMQRLKDEY